MDTFAIKIWFDEAKLCTFYTVRKDEAKDSETDQFFEKYGNERNRYCESAYELLRLINHAIGDVYGAIDDFFDRTENNAQALPPKPKGSIPEIYEIGKNFPLRLYCYRISESIVVLFNGGVKDARTSQEGSTSMKFQEAQTFAKRIADALQDGTIIIATDNRTLTDFQGNQDYTI